MIDKMIKSILLTIAGRV